MDFLENELNILQNPSSLIEEGTEKEKIQLAYNDLYVLIVNQYKQKHKYAFYFLEKYKNYYINNILEKYNLSKTYTHKLIQKFDTLQNKYKTKQKNIDTFYIDFYSNIITTAFWFILISIIILIIAF